MSLEELAKGLGAEEEVTAEQILMEFLKEKTKNFVTEIPVPMPITVLDALVPYFYANFGKLEGDVLKALLRWYRINMISHKRKGRTEILNTLKAQFGKEDQPTDALAKLLQK